MHMKSERRPTSFPRGWRWFAIGCLIVDVWVAPISSTATGTVIQTLQISTAINTAASNSSVLTLRQAISDALQANPGILAGKRDIQASLEEVTASKGTLYGEMDAAMTYQHLNDPQLLRPLSGPITPAAMSTMPFAQDQLHVGVTYTYPLYVGGKLQTRIKIARLGVVQARDLLTGTSTDVIYNVTALYVQCQALSGDADAMQQEIEELSATRKDIALGVKVGNRPEVDLLKVDDRISEAQSNLVNVRAQQKKLIDAMFALMGRSVKTYPSLEPLPSSLPELPSDDSELLALARQRSSIKIASSQVSQAKERISLAQAEIDPSVALQASYFQHIDASIMDRTKETWYVGMAINFPLIDGGLRRAELSKSKEQEKAAQERLESVKLQADVDLQNAITSWQVALEQIKASNSQFAAAHEVTRIEQLRYDTGAGDIEDLLRARTREVAADSAQINAKALAILSEAQISRVTEKEIVR